jgi:type IV pilus assembly protein PilW
LLLLTGVVAIFTSSRVSYESTNQLSRVQETGRFALELMAKHIRSAGFSGCSRQPKYVSTAVRNSTNLFWNFAEGAVRGFDASSSGWTPALDTAIEQAFSGSDVLVVRGPRLDSEPVTVTTKMVDAQDPLVVDDASSIRTAGEVVMAYSCEAQAFFFATPSGNTLTHAVSASGVVPGNEFATTSHRFPVNAEVIPVETVVYYVRASAASIPPNNTLPVGTNSLWRKAGASAPEELVQGVEQMQVEYGIDTNGDRLVDTYGPATATTNWQRAIAVRIALLVSSPDQYGTDRDGRTYQLLNTTVNPPGDRRLREVFTTTVSVRNQARVD